MWWAGGAGAPFTSEAALLTSGSVRAGARNGTLIAVGIPVARWKPLPEENAIYCGGRELVTSGMAGCPAGLPVARVDRVNTILRQALPGQWQRSAPERPSFSLRIGTTD